MAHRSALAGRIIRLIFILIVGIGLTGAGIHNFSDPAQTGIQPGTASEYLGPHGNAIGMTVLGLLILALSGYFLLRYIRLARNAPPINPPGT